MNFVPKHFFSLHALYRVFFLIWKYTKKLLLKLLLAFSYTKNRLICCYFVSGCDNVLVVFVTLNCLQHPPSCPWLVPQACWLLWREETGTSYSIQNNCYWPYTSISSDQLLSQRQNDLNFLKRNNMKESNDKDEMIKYRSEDYVVMWVYIGTVVTFWV